MTANDGSPDGAKTLTDSFRSRVHRLLEDIETDLDHGQIEGAQATARQLTKEIESVGLEERILQLMDGAELTYIDADSLAVNLDVSPERIRPALEALEHRGEIESLPVMYERTQDKR